MINRYYIDAYGAVEDGDGYWVTYRDYRMHLKDAEDRAAKLEKARGRFAKENAELRNQNEDLMHGIEQMKKMFAHLVTKYVDGCPELKKDLCVVGGEECVRCWEEYLRVEVL